MASDGQRKATGDDGERIAEGHLISLGFSIEARNWTCRAGEIDLIAYQPGVIVFVEVRTVRTHYLASPTMTVNRAKQRKIGHAAQTYLAARPSIPERIRFDVIGVVLSRSAPAIEHIENAFVPETAF